MADLVIPPIEKAVLDQFGLQPGLDRANILPIAGRRSEGNLELAAPQFVYDIAKAFVAPGLAAQGYELTPEEALNVAMNITGGGLGGSSIAGPTGKGILGMGTKPRGIPLRRYKADLSTYDRESLMDYARSLQAAQDIPESAKSEMIAAVLSGANGKHVIFDGGNYAGAVAYHVDDALKTIEIDHFGAAIKGTGRQMVEDIEDSFPKGYRILLAPSDEGLPFWKALGFSESGVGSQLEKVIK